MIGLRPARQFARNSAIVGPHLSRTVTQLKTEVGHWSRRAEFQSSVEPPRE